MGDSKVNLQKEYGPNCIGNVIRILIKIPLLLIQELMPKWN